MNIDEPQEMYVYTLEAPLPNVYVLKYKAKITFHVLFYRNVTRDSLLIFQILIQNFLEVSHENFVENYDLETLRVYDFIQSSLNQV
jgi:hypothetical protein